MGKNLTKEEFIQKAKEIHGDKYDYLDEYVNTMAHIHLRCKKCGNLFSITPNNHLSKKQGCTICSNSHPHKAYSIDEWIEKCTEKHNGFYLYDKNTLNYKNGKSTVNITCPKHGQFSMLARHHLAGHGCTQCYKENYRKTHSKTNEQFIKEAQDIHGNVYTYLDTYVNAKTKLRILCHNCGNTFEQTPHKHISGKHGCPFCNTSKLENTVKNELTKNNIKFVHQKRFSWLGLQSLDFYLPDYNIAIECQGGQHFYAVEHFGGESNFKLSLERDERKRNLCEENNIKLLYFAEKQYSNSPYQLFINKNELLKEILSNGN